ncbi:DUF998 domain-containing protein [Microbacterium sp. GXF7504]
MTAATVATAGAPARRLDDESWALLVGVAAFAVGFLVALPVFWGRDLAIAGRGSLGDFSAVAGALAAAVGVVAARALARIRREQAAPTARFQWFDVAALAVAIGLTALMGWIGVATVMGGSFQGAELYPTPAMLLAATATGLSAYLGYVVGMNLSAGQLSLVLAVFLVVGVVTAMLSSSDPAWWQMNLSALGITHDISSLTFNLTLIVSGVIVTTIARVGTASVPADTRPERTRRTIVRSMFVLLGIMLACVGIFPVDRFFLLHNTVATGMAVAYGVLVIGLPWLMPRMPRVFLALGYVFTAVIVVLAVLFFTGIYNLTAVELVAAVMIFAWIILFLRNVQALGREHARP